MTSPTKTVTQEQINSILQELQKILSIKNNLTITDTTNEYCELSVKIEEDRGRNIATDKEYIIFTPFTITLSDPSFSIFDYSIVIKYYDLEPDFDTEDVSPVIEREIPLTTGDNEIGFDEYPVYLQEDFNLLIKKEESE